MVTRRQRKVADLIHEELGRLLLQKVADPRVAGVTLTAVEVSADLERAIVFYGVLADEPERMQAAQDGLEHARGFLRRMLAESVGMRQVPDLVFKYDRSLRQGARIESLLRSIREGEDRPAVPRDEREEE